MKLHYHFGLGTKQVEVVQKVKFLNDGLYVDLSKDNLFVEAMTTSLVKPSDVQDAREDLLVEIYSPKSKKVFNFKYEWEQTDDYIILSCKEKETKDWRLFLTLRPLEDLKKGNQ